MMGNHVNGMQMEDKELPETRDTVRDQDALKAESQEILIAMFTKLVNKGVPGSTDIYFGEVG